MGLDMRRSNSTNFTPTFLDLAGVLSWYLSFKTAGYTQLEEPLKFQFFIFAAQKKNQTVQEFKTALSSQYLIMSQIKI